LHQGHKFISRKFAKSGGWDGVVRLFRNNSFPVGLLPAVKSVLEKNSAEFTINDCRQAISYGRPLDIDENSFFKPRDYQLKALEAAKKSGSGIIKIATGGGKTGVIAMIAGNYNVDTVIYVIGVELLYQMKSTIEALYPDIDVGIVGDGICDIKKITIATIWSAAAAFNKKIDVFDNDCSKEKATQSSKNKSKIKKMIRGANLFILDECQYAAANTVQFLHKESHSARHRFLFSASPWRDSGDDILIEAVGGPKVYDLKASALINRGFLVRPEIHFLSVPVIKNMPRNYQQVYKKYIVENEERNDMIRRAALKLIRSGKKVLILVVRVSHGEVLKKMLEKDCDVGYLDGQKTSKERLGTISKMKSGGINLIIASKIFDQGVDIPELDALILAGSGKSTGRALQRIGRVIRKRDGKEKAIVVDFMDNAKFLRDHSEVRMSVYKTEPEFKVKVYAKK
tara:strand:- start:657 stop:2021 length:1365 start_codon:yes stop_codon:yes gene_type:complete